MDKNVAVLLANMSTKIIDLEIKNQIVTNILVENGSITRDELEEKYKTIDESDFAEIRSGIMESLDVYIKNFDE